MSPRPKSPKSNGLPAHLSPTGNGYFRYQPPNDITLPNGKVLKKGRNIGMGKDRAVAIEAAKELNALLPRNRLLARISGDDALFTDFLARFRDTLLPERQASHELSDETIRNHYHDKLPHIERAFAGMTIRSIGVRECSAFLNQFSPAQSNKYRSTLSLIFTYAIAEGLRSDNPANATIPKVERVKRQRLTLEGFRAVYAKAPQWGKNAMDLALQTLQRRRDISVMRFRKTEKASAYVVDGDALYVIQHKTAKKRTKRGEVQMNPSAYIRIPLAGEILDIVRRCHDEIASPFLVHRMPVRVKSRDRRAREREHPTQLMRGELSRMFQRARDASGFFDDVPSDERPTFHEIRALGAELYRKAGIDPQALLGHTTAKQTREYLTGHEPEWTEVAAGLNI